VPAGADQRFARQPDFVGRAGGRRLLPRDAPARNLGAALFACGPRATTPRADGERAAATRMCWRRIAGSVASREAGARGAARPRNRAAARSAVGTGRQRVLLDRPEGLEVVNRGGVILGRVTAVTSNGAHAILRIAGDDRVAERLIPFVPAYIDRVDAERRRIDVDWEPDF